MSEVRPARAEDAEAIASVHVASWRETYLDLLSGEFLDGLDVADRAAFWRRVIEQHPGKVHVGLVEGGVVGFSAVREVPDGPRLLELVTVYVLAGQHGTGLGQRLLDVALAAEPAFLWVAERNARAIAFYSRNGFRPDGARQPVDAWEGLVEIRMVR